MLVVHPSIVLLAAIVAWLTYLGAHLGRVPSIRWRHGLGLGVVV